MNMTHDTDTNVEHCPLCLSDNWRSKKVLFLYGHRVCKKCYYKLVNRRQVAFILDLIFLWIAATTIGGILGYLSPGFATSAFGLAEVLGLIITVAFSFKDGISGHSPAKYLLGIQVVDSNTMEPIGFGQSFKRNTPILAIQASISVIQILAAAVSPIFGILSLIANLAGLVLFLIMAYQLKRGPRWGDEYANTKVILKKQRFRIPFDTRGIFCQNCGYNLTGSVSGFCTECGTATPQEHAEASSPAS